MRRNRRRLRPTSNPSRHRTGLRSRKSAGRHRAGLRLTGLRRKRPRGIRPRITGLHRNGIPGTVPRDGGPHRNGLSGAGLGRLRDGDLNGIGRRRTWSNGGSYA
ncbi:hypothetical protein GCM10009828_064910 [Actinoplanes couchii]|uniref:Uncharacterized protein n=1 Tax=Actinoplanes couchii TaxID=403638 RepID=A0ABQ3X2Z7_9ACTN|nr:hypothetical protein Aco03nite_012890 [Actinoplanes couchii]